MNKDRLSSLAVFSLWIGVGACVKPEPTSSEPLVRLFHSAEGPTAVPFATISEVDYRKALARIRFERQGSLAGGALPPSVRERVLEELIERRLFAAEAARLKVKASTTSVERELASIASGLTVRELERRLIESYQTTADLRLLIEERLTIGALMHRHAHPVLEISEAEIQKAWDELSPEKRTLAERVRAAQIVVRTEEEGAEIVRQLQRGADFATLARQHSLGPEAKRGGELGWFERGVLPAIFDEICFHLSPGQVSVLNPSPYGFHVFKVLERQEQRPLVFEEAIDRLRAKLIQESLEKAEASYLDGLKRKTRIDRNHALLAAME